MSPAPPPQPPPASEESADLFDYALLRDHLGFTLRAVGRHPGVALLVLASVVGASVEGLRVLPRTYHAETKLLAQRNQVMGAIGNPNRSIPWDADAPTRAAQETVLRHDNLVLLVKQTDLLDGWERTRAPAVRLKDWVVRRFTGPMNDDDRMEALIGLLEKRLYVETGDQTVTIAVDWPDAQAAFRPNLGGEAEESASFLRSLRKRPFADKTTREHVIQMLQKLLHGHVHVLLRHFADA